MWICNSRFRAFLRVIPVTIFLAQGCQEAVLDESAKRERSALVERDAAMAEKSLEAAKTPELQARRAALSKDVAMLKDELNTAEQSLDQLASARAQSLLKQTQELKRETQLLSAGDRASQQQIELYEKQAGDLRRRVDQLKADIRELTK